MIKYRSKKSSNGITEEIVLSRSDLQKAFYTLHVKITYKKNVLLDKFVCLAESEWSEVFKAMFFGEMDSRGY